MKKIILTKKLAILYKISIILGLTAFGLMFFLPLLFEEDVGYIVFCVLIAIGLMLGVIVFLYPFIFIDPKKNTYFTGAEAKATALSGRVGGQLNIFGLQIEIGLSYRHY